MTVTATVRSDGETLRQEVTVNGRHTIVTDEPASLGGTDTGPTPEELLPTALAACITATVTLYVLRKGWKLDWIDVHIDYDPDSVPRHFDVVIALPDTLDANQVQRLHEIAGHCPVRRSLEAGFSFQERVATGPRA